MIVPAVLFIFSCSLKGHWNVTYFIFIVLLIYRHPESAKRPNISGVVGKLSYPDFILLKNDGDDIDSNQQACMVLGSELSNGQSLYKDLQEKYYIY